MFKNPFSFNGRIRRTEYGITVFMYLVFWYFINAAVTSADGPIKILGLLYIPLMWLTWAQGAKRCHDLNNSGWWQIIPFYFLWMLFQKGTPGPNRFDPEYVDGMFYGAEDYERPFMVDEPADPMYNAAATLAAVAITEEIVEDSLAPNDDWQDDQDTDDDSDYSSDNDSNNDF